MTVKEFFEMARTDKEKAKEVLKTACSDAKITVDDFKKIILFSDYLLKNTDENGNFIGELPKEIFTEEEEKQIKEQKQFMTILRSKPINEMASMVGKKIIPNQLNNTGKISKAEVDLVFEKFSELKGTLGISTHKLLIRAISEFANNNHIGKNSEVKNTNVYIPLNEYGKQCGYDLEKHAKNTEEEQKKEDERVNNAYHNLRKKINKDLSVLSSATLSFKEKIKGKPVDFYDLHLIQAKGIARGYIHLEFSNNLAKYLMELPLTQYPTALLSIDERNTNAYNIGIKMSEHGNNYNNISKGTANLLKVKSLLAVTNLPDINESAVKKNGWTERIKEPLENALETLVQCGILNDWEYTKPKGVEMTYKEATNFATYYDWEDTLICFTLNNPIDHTLRIKAKEEERKKAIKKNTKQKNK